MFELRFFLRYFVDWFVLFHWTNFTTKLLSPISEKYVKRWHGWRSIWKGKFLIWLSVLRLKTPHTQTWCYKLNEKTIQFLFFLKLNFKITTFLTKNNRKSLLLLFYNIRHAYRLFIVKRKKLHYCCSKFEFVNIVINCNYMIPPSFSLNTIFYFFIHMSCFILCVCIFRFCARFIVNKKNVLKILIKK